MKFHPAYHKAQALMDRKSLDYNKTTEADPARVEYFPFGTKSYLTMIHTKSRRMLQIAEKDNPNFEKMEDSVLDMINYCAFFYAYLEEQKGKK